MTTDAAPARPPASPEPGPYAGGPVRVPPPSAGTIPAVPNPGRPAGPSPPPPSPATPFPTAAAPAPPAAPTAPSAPAPPPAAHPVAPAPPPPTARSAPGATHSDVWQPQSLIPAPRPVPATGWRRTVFRATRGAVNPGLSTADQRRAELRDGIVRPVASRAGERIAVMSTKGGVGKTTTTLMLGHALAGERGDRVVALDANPDYGTLGYRVSAGGQMPTVRDLLVGLDEVCSYRDVRAYTTQATSRLEVLAGDADPAVSEAFTAQDYRAVMDVLAVHYNVMLTDCGTGVLHDAMAAVLDLATQLVIVTGPAVDQARHADHLLRWLHQHGRGGLVAQSVVVVNGSRNDVAVDLGQLVAHFRSLVRAVVEVPYDPVLAAGGIDDLARLDRSTQDAYLALAAEVAARFGAS